MDWKAFETLARERMSKHLGVTLVKRQLPGVPKKFDMVSADGTVVGRRVPHAWARATPTPSEVHGDRRTCVAARTDHGPT